VSRGLREIREWAASRAFSPRSHVDEFGIFAFLGPLGGQNVHKMVKISRGTSKRGLKPATTNSVRRFGTFVVAGFSPRSGSGHSPRYEARSIWLCQAHAE